MGVFETDQELRSQTEQRYKFFVMYGKGQMKLFEHKKDAVAFDKKMNTFKVGEQVLTYENIPAKIVGMKGEWITIKIGNELHDYDPLDIRKR